MTNNVEGVLGNPVMQFLDSTGAPLVGGTVETYVAGSSTHATTYQDSAGATPNAWPIVLDSRGSCVLWGDPTLYYKIIVKDALGAIVYSADNLPILGAITSTTSSNVPFVVNIAALRALTKPTGASSIVVQGYYTAGDGGGSIYHWVSSSSATDNGGSVINPTGNLGAGRWIMDIAAGDPVSVLKFGAKGDGATDDKTAIQNAINAQVMAFLPWGKNFRCASGLTVGKNQFLTGFGISAAGGVPDGAKLTFDLSVATCVTLGGSGGDNGPCGVWGFNILRAAGTPPAGSIGLLVQYVNNPIVHDINVVSHQIGGKWLTNDTEGITCFPERFFTNTIYDAHIVVDTWPELYFSECRFGANGLSDVDCNTYIRIQGGSTVNAAAGPNTFICVNCHFNQGNHNATHWIELVNQTAASISDIGGLHFSNTHIESVSGAYIYSDATFTLLQRTMFSNVHFNNIVPTFALNNATKVSEMQFSNCFLAGDVTFTPTLQYDQVLFSNCKFFSGAAITGVSGATLTIDGCTSGANITLAGTFGAVTVKGTTFTAGAFANNATISNQDIDVPTLGTWTPALKFSGSATGITYSLQQGKWQQIGRFIYCSFAIILTSKGAQVGTATITGLPVAPSQLAGTDGAGGGGTLYTQNLAAMNSPAVGITAAGGVKTLNLYQTGAASLQALQDTNFTNTSVVYGTFMYMAAP